jgi:hypothetical protein
MKVLDEIDRPLGMGLIRKDLKENSFISIPETNLCEQSRCTQ